jgi:hypothetical protein
MVMLLIRRENARRMKERLNIMDCSVIYSEK